MPIKKKTITDPRLGSWETLNEAVLNLSDLKELKKLLGAETKGRKRARFVARIQSRMNRVSIQGKGNAGYKPKAPRVKVPV